MTQMQAKDIKTIIRKKLKKQYPNWVRLGKKQKKTIAKEVLTEVVKGYDVNQEIKNPLPELLGIEEQVSISGITTLDEMAGFIDWCNNNMLIKLGTYKQRSVYIKDEELKFIDDLLDDHVINSLLLSRGYRPSERELYPSHLLRAELLKCIKYPEISYRKFCSKTYLGMEQKQNRAFIGLPLNRAKIIDHTQLSHFRSALSFGQMVNLMVYVIYHFSKSGLLGDHVLHGIDSTELANECARPLASLKIGEHNIRIYSDLDCDCGKRRNKRDKSPYVVGYRLHTLTVINPCTGHSFPLVSLLAPANHHDSNYLVFLVKLAQAIGIELELITADEAYEDSDRSLYEQTGVHLVTPPHTKTSVPENIDGETMQVMLDDFCEIPMQYMGYDQQGHEFKCGAAPGMCPRSSSCSKYRFIPQDSGLFQGIPAGIHHVAEAVKIRKNTERPFNLLKNREGLEPIRARSQHGLLARSSFATMSTLLLEMAGMRRKKKTKKTKSLQLQLLDVA